MVRSFFFLFLSILQWPRSLILSWKKFLRWELGRRTFGRFIMSAFCWRLSSVALSRLRYVVRTFSKKLVSRSFRIAPASFFSFLYLKWEVWFFRQKWTSSIISSTELLSFLYLFWTHTNRPISNSFWQIWFFPCRFCRLSKGDLSFLSFTNVFFFLMPWFFIL